MNYFTYCINIYKKKIPVNNIYKKKIPIKNFSKNLFLENKLISRYLYFGVSVSHQKKIPPIENKENNIFFKKSIYLHSTTSFLYKEARTVEIQGFFKKFYFFPRIRVCIYFCICDTLLLYYIILYYIILYYIILYYISHFKYNFITRIFWFLFYILSSNFWIYISWRATKWTRIWVITNTSADSFGWRTRRDTLPNCRQSAHV